MAAGACGSVVEGVGSKADFWEFCELLGERALAGPNDLAFSQARVSCQGVDGVLCMVTRAASIATDWVRADDDRLRALRQAAESGPELSAEEQCELRSLAARYDEFVTAGVHALDWACRAPRELFVAWVPLGLAWAVNPGLVPQKQRGRLEALGSSLPGSPASAASAGSGQDGPADGTSFGPDGGAPPAWRLARLLPGSQLCRVAAVPARRRLGQRPKLLTLVARCRGVDVESGPFELPAAGVADIVAELRQHLPMLQVADDDGAVTPPQAPISGLGQSIRSALGRLSFASSQGRRSAPPPSRPASGLPVDAPVARGYSSSATPALDHCAGE
eukprot:TRINITY_DN35545_c0_g1_i1.p1 TRINITY_DN35545_c0_g1~~TRINITY_DN35545_c0_g1_i1.p1  ORF type:complete len:349 (+),score=89.50 TRINITY_DN35545_c0_g1_i1:52-1047(+)